MTTNRTMVDYVNGGCRTVDDSKRFVDDWLRSVGEPCTVCRTAYKSVCTLYGDKREMRGSRKTVSLH